MPFACPSHEAARGRFALATGFSRAAEIESTSEELKDTVNVPSSVAQEVSLSLKQQPVKWSSFLKYLGSPISGIEDLSFLEDSEVAQVVKICGSLGSACRSAVALPLSRIVDLNQSLVTPIALLNCVAWVPFLKQGGPWYSSMCNHCLLYTSPSPRDRTRSRMPSSA